MAWAYTNNPAGRYCTDIGYILSEILYAINERQHMMGVTISTWGAYGSYPAHNAFAGQKRTVAHSMIDAARAAFVASLPSGESNIINKTATAHTTHEMRATNAAWTACGNLATLYNAAMGAGTTWQTADLTGKPVAELTVALEELMKCVELLNYWEWKDRDFGLAGNDWHYIFDAGPEADTDDIHAAAIANGIGSGSYHAGWEQWVYAEVNYTGVAYTDYVNQLRTFKFTKAPTSAPYPTVNEFRIAYDIIDVGGNATDDLDWELRTISNAEYVTTAWAGDGTLRDSVTFNAATTGAYLTYATPGWIVDGTNFWLRMDQGTTNPFPADPGNDRLTYAFEGAGFPLAATGCFRIRQSYNGWTYN